jgi:hypothetical protein
MEQPDAHFMNLSSLAGTSEALVDDAVFRILAPMHELKIFENAAQWSNLTKR